MRIPKLTDLIHSPRSDLDRWGEKGGEKGASLTSTVCEGGSLADTHVNA